MSTPNQLTQQEKQACVILSELFLDTELTQLGLNHITSSLRPLGISVPTLEHILRYDLFPILSPNLLSVAGEWQGFNEDWLLRRVQATRSAGGSGWMKSGVDLVAWHTLGGGICSNWDDIKEGLNEVDVKHIEAGFVGHASIRSDSEGFLFREDKR